MEYFEEHPDAAVRKLAARARALGWYDQTSEALPPITREFWDECGVRKVRFTFTVEHMFEAGLHPRDFSWTAEERLKHSIEVAEGEAQRVLAEANGQTNFENGSKFALAAQLRDQGALARSYLSTGQTVELSESAVRIDQLRSAIDHLELPNPKDGTKRRSNAKLIDAAIASGASGNKRLLPSWFYAEEKTLKRMRADGKSAWALAGFVARKYTMDQNSLSSRIKKMIAKGLL